MIVGSDRQLHAKSITVCSMATGQWLGGDHINIGKVLWLQRLQQVSCEQNHLQGCHIAELQTKSFARLSHRRAVNKIICKAVTSQSCEQNHLQGCHIAELRTKSFARLSHCRAANKIICKAVTSQLHALCGQA